MCGRAACVPRPMISTTKLSSEAMIPPRRVANRPNGMPGMLCTPSISSIAKRSGCALAPSPAAAALHLEAERCEGRRDDFRGAMLLEAGLGMGRQMMPPRRHVALEFAAVIHRRMLPSVLMVPRLLASLGAGLIA